MFDPEVLVGDSLEVLPNLPEGMFQCCVTSPPYWGLRDYDHAAQIGAEESPTDYVNNIVKSGFYHAPVWNKDYPKLQILTVEDILAGKTVDLPPNIQTFKRAEKLEMGSDDQRRLGFE